MKKVEKLKKKEKNQSLYAVLYNLQGIFPRKFKRAKKRAFAYSFRIGLLRTGKLWFKRTMNETVV